MPLWLQILLLPAAAYLAGSIPFGLLLTRLLAGADVRRLGSGNIGATNVRRVAGNRVAAATLGADLAKGLVPAALAAALIDPATGWGAGYGALVAAAAVAGHMFPVYLGFRTGGKGVATAAGAFFALAPTAVVIALLVFVLMVCVGDRVSVGSLAAALILPLAVHLTGHGPALTAAALAVAAAIGWAHRANIARLWRGKEPRIGL